MCDTLIKKYKYKLKGVGPLTYHLGCDFGRDKDGTYYFGPIRYIERMLGAYKTMFGTEPTVYSTPLEKNDHPEIDQSELLGEEDTTKYQSMIGALQWVISLGRFDIATAVMTMSRFRAAPREGHLKRLKHIYGYLSGRKDGAIRVRTEMPDMSEFPPQDFDWMYTVYGAVKEMVPKDIPKALGKPVTSVSYVDCLLYTSPSPRDS